MVFYCFCLQPVRNCSILRPCWSSMILTGKYVVMAILCLLKGVFKLFYGRHAYTWFVWIWIEKNHMFKRLFICGSVWWLVILLLRVYLILRQICLYGNIRILPNLIYIAMLSRFTPTFQKSEITKIKVTYQKFTTGFYMNFQGRFYHIDSGNIEFNGLWQQFLLMSFSLCVA